MSTLRSSFSFWGPLAAFVSIALRIAVAPPAAPPLSPDPPVVAGPEVSDDLLELPHADTVSAMATSTASATGERRI